MSSSCTQLAIITRSTVYWWLLLLWLLLRKRVCELLLQRLGVVQHWVTLQTPAWHWPLGPVWGLIQESPLPPSSMLLLSHWVLCSCDKLWWGICDVCVTMSWKPSWGLLAVWRHKPQQQVATMYCHMGSSGHWSMHCGILLKFCLRTPCSQIPSSHWNTEFNAYRLLKIQHFALPARAPSHWLVNYCIMWHYNNYNKYATNILFTALSFVVVTHSQQKNMSLYVTVLFGPQCSEAGSVSRTGDWAAGTRHYPGIKIPLILPSSVISFIKKKFLEVWQEQEQTWSVMRVTQQQHCTTVSATRAAFHVFGWPGLGSQNIVTIGINRFICLYMTLSMSILNITLINSV